MILFNTLKTKTIKMWMYIPVLLLEKFLSLFGYISHLCFNYDDISANIDTGMNYYFPKKPKNEITRIKLSYIKNKKIRYSLFLSGIFKRWYIYKSFKFGERADIDANREIIYITKDKDLTCNSLCHYYRIPTYKINKKYNHTKIRNYLKKINLTITEFYKIEPQIFIITAAHNIKHDKIKEERDKIYKYKINNSMEKIVKKMIKKNNLFSNEKIYGVFDDKPVIHNIVEYNRIDLVKKILDSAKDDEERSKLVNYRTWKGEFNLFKKPIEFAKSDEMKKILSKWEDLSKYDRYRKIIKIKNGIK